MCLLSPVDGGEDDGGDDGVTTVAVLSVVEDNLEGVFDVDTGETAAVSVDNDGVVTRGGCPTTTSASTFVSVSVVALFIVIVVVVARVRARIRWISMRTQRS